MPFRKKHGANPNRVIAAIDIGTTSIRLAIAQIKEQSKIQLLDTLQQSVSLGRDTFTKGIIQRSSIEDCVQALKSFKKVLKEYEINSLDQIKIVATSAVREALNKDVFLDRVKIATGFTIEVIDEVDVSRLTYLSIRSYMECHAFKCENDVLVAEMSGGNTEVLHLRKGNVILSKGYRLGALRLREMLGEYRALLSSHKELMNNEISRTINLISLDIDKKKKMTIIAVGGDARMMASQICPDWNGSDPVTITLDLVKAFTSRIMDLSIDEIVNKFHIAFNDAETLGPSLLFYINLAEVYNLKNIVVSDISMRHGLLREIAMVEWWTDDYVSQIVNSALEVGRKFSFDESHALHVAEIASILFTALQNEHALNNRYKLLLKIASLLHDIGSYISVRSHHKHSHYLIQNSELFGLNRKDIQIIALIARYHRRSTPKPIHAEYMSFDHESRLIIVKLAAILRVADALDRSNNHRIKEISCSKKKDTLLITIPDIEDISLEQLALQSKGTMFEDVYGMKVILRKKSLFLE
jgi:exopolyphosphatase/guanosine-5'-triphosphate,3'-diphosphate pyrophosphatase